MRLSEDELRQMIRDAVARQRSLAAAPGAAADALHAPAPAAHVHASHGTFALAPGNDGDCIIEPTVRCNHCGYCLSLGH